MTLWQLVCRRRGYDPSWIENIDIPSLRNPKDTDVLCRHLKAIHDAGRRIVIIPDFDMDGISAGTLGLAGLAELGFNVALYIPVPGNGYGFRPATIDVIRSKYPDVSAIITCDNGITCHEGIAYANSLGIEMLVTDHHMPDGRPFLAAVTVDPMREDDPMRHETTEGKICGAFVLYKVLHRYSEMYCSMFEREQIARLRVFAGTGTVADVMPVVYENRQVVRDSVAICRVLYDNGSHNFVDSITGHPIYKAVFQGLWNVLDRFVQDGYMTGNDIDEKFFAWSLVPTFNSIKRLDGDMSDAFGAFIDTSASVEHVETLYGTNQKRKAMSNSYYEQLLDEQCAGKQPYAPYIYISSAIPGMLGLLANKLEQLNGVPTLVVTYSGSKDGMQYHGSGRSPQWYPALKRLKASGIYAAGHQVAFGVGMRDAAVLKATYDYISEDVKNFDEARRIYESMPSVDYHIDMYGDGDVGIDIDAFYAFLHDCHSVKPFGEAFEEPRGIITFDPNDEQVSHRVMKGKHVRFTLPFGFQVVMWNSADKLDKMLHSERVGIMGTLGVNEYKDIYTMQFVGNDVRLMTKSDVKAMAENERKALTR